MSETTSSSGTETPRDTSVALTRVPELSEGLKALVNAVKTSEAAQAAIAELIKRFPEAGTIVIATRHEIATAAAVSTDPKGSETGLETDPRLARYQEQWSKIPEKNRGGLTWEQAKARLTADKLVLADGLSGGGFLFGVDRQGKLLFADKDKDPTVFAPKLCNLTYAQAREAVMKKKDDGKGKGEEVLTGYEMFPYGGGKNGLDKSPEIQMFEAATKSGRFIEPETPTGKYEEDWRGSWLKPELDSDGNSSRPRFAFFYPNGQRVYVRNDDAGDHGTGLGVRRLLRV